MSGINLYELYGLKSALEEAIKGFCIEVLGVNVKPKIEILPYTPENRLVYLPNTKEVYVPIEYLIRLRNALENKNLEEIVSLLSLALHASLHQFLDEKRKKKILFIWVKKLWQLR